MNLIEKSFSRSSKSYEKYSYIQQNIAKYLVSKINYFPKNIIDLGAGIGAVRNSIDWKLENFLAVDFSEKMLNLHKNSYEVEKLKADFDSDLFFEKISQLNYQILISSSAIQWSKNIFKLLNNLDTLNIPLYISAFTSQTFQEIHKEFKINSPILSKKDILNNCHGFKYEVINYTIQFDSSIELLRYIKKSGVSGGNNRVSNKKIREFINADKIHTLTLEILFLWKEN